MACNWDRKDIFGKTGTTLTALPEGPAGGDLRGTYPDPIVVAVQVDVEGALQRVTLRDIDEGQFLQRQGDELIGADDPLGGVNAGGDLSGAYPDPQVIAVTVNDAGTPQSLTIGPITPGQILQRNGNTLVGADPGASSSTFTSLMDTPNSYVGQNGRFLRVNEATSALIYAPLLDTGSALELETNLDLDNNAIEEVATVTFANFPTSNPTSAASIDFALAQKQKLILNSNLQITLTFPGIGNYMLIYEQGTAGDAVPNFMLNASHSGTLLFPGGELRIARAAGSLTAIAIFFDGNSAFMTSAPMMTPGSVVLTPPS